MEHMLKPDTIEKNDWKISNRYRIYLRIVIILYNRKWKLSLWICGTVIKRLIKPGVIYGKYYNN